MYEKQAGLQYPCTFIGYPPPLLHPASARCGAVDMQTNDDESQLVPNGSIELQSGKVPRRSSPDRFPIWESDVFPRWLS